MFQITPLRKLLAMAVTVMASLAITPDAVAAKDVFQIPNSSVTAHQKVIAWGICRMIRSSGDSFAIPVRTRAEWFSGESSFLRNITAPALVTTCAPPLSDVADVAAGRKHSCALFRNGGVKCWGDNDVGQLGNGSAVAASRIPVQVTGLTSGVVKIAARYDNTCALKADGTVWCWGINQWGSLGDGRVSYTGKTIPDNDALRAQRSPSRVSITGVSSISSSCAVKWDGTAWCWGRNTWGQAGVPDDGSEMVLSPVRVTSLGTDVAEINDGTFARCARKTGGGIWCWGANDFGVLRVADENYKTHVATMKDSGSAKLSFNFNTVCSLTTGGAVRCWGDNRNGKAGAPWTSGVSPDWNTSISTPAGLGSGVLDISGEFEHHCAEKANGTWCWGGNYYNSFGTAADDAGANPVPKLNEELSEFPGTVFVGKGWSCKSTPYADIGILCVGSNEDGVLGTAVPYGGRSDTAVEVTF